MITDIGGRVNNVQLPATKPLLPLFEAINNSIFAIEDAGEQDGQIEIEVVRDEYSLFAKSESSDERQDSDIDGFLVRDNGIGFDEQNYTAFNTSDTTFKASRGGKGIGRFLWLVAFDIAEIDSVFQENGALKRRSFIFFPQNPGVKDHTLNDAPGQKKQTTVHLKNFKEKYKKQCPKKLETIATYIVEEFLDVFLGPDCPQIILIDKAIEQPIDLNKFYETKIVAHFERAEVDIKGEQIAVFHVRLYSTHINEHKMCLCAHHRPVIREKISGIPNLIKRFEDNEGKEFVYAVYVHSQILDSSVNANRTNFNLAKDKSELFPDEITLADVKDTVRELSKEYLSPYTKPVADKKRERINQFVEDEGAMYRPILRHMEHKLDTIEPDATDDEIDRHLYQAYNELQTSVREEGKELLKQAASDDEDFENFKSRFDEFFEKTTEIKRADLARYVCHRKAIIEFLTRQLARQSDGKYSLEERIHKIIFPLGKTSNDILFEDHNLWLIDEKLAFHMFLSSDLPIKHSEPLESDSRKEPDILVFDRAVAFSDSPDVPFTSITIIEFKRPQRNEYLENENPFTQITNYIDEIKAGRASRADGRSFPISDSLPFYCYVVCDITTKLKKWAYNFELQETPDALGFFGYKRHYNAYCEVISYSKLVADAEKRNRAFFEKLGLPIL